MQGAVLDVVASFVDLNNVQQGAVRRGIDELRKLEQPEVEGDQEFSTLLQRKRALEQEILGSAAHLQELDAQEKELVRRREEALAALAATEKECAFVGELQSKFVDPFVALRADDAEGRKKLLQGVRQAAGDQQLEGVKAFRMIREKLERLEAPRETQQEGEGAEEKVSVVADNVSASVVEAVARMKKLIKEDSLDAVTGNVVNCGIAARDLLQTLPAEECDLALEAFRLMLGCRFQQEPEIPLYVALHHNTLVFMKGVCLTKGKVQQMALFGMEAARVMSAFLDKVKDNIRAQITLRDGNAKRKADELEGAVKRCGFEIEGVKKAWKGVLEEDILQWAVGSLVNYVLERAFVDTVFALSKEGFSADESVIFAECLKRSLSMAVKALGLSEGASELEKRAHAPLYPKARRLQELMVCSLAQVEQNLPKFKAVFSRDELAQLLCAMFDDSKNRKKVMDLLTKK